MNSQMLAESCISAEHADGGETESHAIRALEYTET